MENINEQQTSQETITTNFNYEEEKKRKIDQLLLSQNYPFGLIAGIIAGLLGAVLWAVITVSTEYQIGYMAVAIGLMVGYSIRFIGKGIQPIFGITGAIISLVSCVLGNVFSLIGFFANSENIGYFQALGIVDFASIPAVMIDTFNPMDLLFYGIAVYEGYKFSIISTE